MPITQKALIVSPFLAYHDYEGVALETGERERLVEDLGDGNAMLLRNHGLLTVGESVGETFVWMHRLETACRYQVDGLAGERPLHFPPVAVQNRTKEQGYATLGPNGFAHSGFEWPALLRKLERERGESYKT